MRYLFIFCLAVSSLAAEDIDYYLQLAAKRNAQLGAERQLTAAAQSDHARESVFSENPEFMFGFMNVPVNSFPALNRDSMSNVSVGISQRIALPWESHYRKTAAAVRAETSAVNLQLREAALRFEVLERINAIHFFTERARNLNDAKKLIAATIRILAVPRKEARNTAGAILEARASMSTVDTELLNNNYELEKAWLDLEALCGETLDHTKIPGTAAAWESVQQPPAQQENEVRHTLVYQKAEGELRAQQAMAALSKAALFPEVKVSAAYMFRQTVPGMSTGDDMVSLSASTPIPVFYPLKNKHEIEGQEHRLRAAEQMLEETRRQLAARIAAERIRLTNLVRSAEDYARTILPAHSSAHRSHLTNINLAGGSPAEALLAYRMYLNAGEERLRQLRDANSARNRLEYLLAHGVKK